MAKRIRQADRVETIPTDGVRDGMRGVVLQVHRVRRLGVTYHYATVQWLSGSRTVVSAATLRRVS